MTKTKNLGLAAFIKMNDIDLIEMDDRFFVFATDKNETDWMVDYQNSCCHKHDITLCELRKLL